MIRLCSGLIFFLLCCLNILLFVFAVDIFRGVIVIDRIVVHIIALLPPVISFEFLLDFSDLVLDQLLVLLFSLLICQINLLAQTASNIFVNKAVRTDWIVSK